MYFFQCKIDLEKETESLNIFKIFQNIFSPVNTSNAKACANALTVFLRQKSLTRAAPQALIFFE